MGRVFAIVGDAPVMTARVIAWTAPGSRVTTDLFETVVAPLHNAATPDRVHVLIAQIAPAELAAWRDDAVRAAPVLVDVREPWEFERCRIEGSLSVPLRELPARTGELSGRSRTRIGVPPRQPQPAGGDVARP